MRVVVGAGEEDVEVAGTTVGPEHRLFLAGALGFSIDIELAPHMAFLSYDDVPGVIGTRRDDVRRGGREHREHGRLEDDGRRKGAHGVLDRLARAARTSSSASRQPGSTTCASSTLAEVPSLGARGGGWVALQFALMLAILVLGVVGPGWPDDARWWFKGAGVLLVFAGALVVAKAGRALGSGFTPFPRPAEEGALVEHGPFGVVRHPVYSGGILFASGISLALSPWALGRNGCARGRLGAQGARRGALPPRALSRLRRLLRTHPLPPRPVPLLIDGR